ncbi:vitelline membrane protein Vm26Ab-like isoform X2 [Coccinella septempunctata]|uniref:vitelline membrane protein Vm26Ab-like isoform X1 n=1 Tax=Coccinella septempunctata TaxID=41139 RepID=UPI001D08CE6E|nr:vitelline membrane protein Vm26Ab-like isoform X1 [Coccinella septempunctata]XP_044747264.1 vitelline membrane protein Vm26Ab-like isoform X2 [Coccinella septempunctata]
MNSIAAVVFFAVVAAASAGIVAPSGLIATSYAAPALTAYSAPLAYNAPLAYSAPLAYTAYSAPIASLGHAAESTVVAGPSGTITNTKSIATPAIAARYALPSAYTYGGLYL